MVKKLYYSFVKGFRCPYCGRKWMWTKARRSLLKIYGYVDISCKCDIEWRVIPKEEGYSYIER